MPYTEAGVALIRKWNPHVRLCLPVPQISRYAVFTDLGVKVRQIGIVKVELYPANLVCEELIGAFYSITPHSVLVSSELTE